MIIHTFCESYDFKGKTVIPFCTYAATYRDETLAEIVNSTPDAGHLTGEGLTSGRDNAFDRPDMDRPYQRGMEQPELLRQRHAYVGHRKPVGARQHTHRYA